MSQRARVTIALAGVLIVAVIGVSALIAFSGAANTTRFDNAAVWSADFAGAESLKIIDLTGDGRASLFAENANTVTVFEPDGQARFAREFSGELSTSLGDVNGDGVPDIVAADGAGVVALDGRGQAIWAVDRPAGLGAATRVAIVKFASGPQVIIGDSAGQLVALDGLGRELWRGVTNTTDYIRGLDDVKVGGTVYLAAANHNGEVYLFDEQGRSPWSYPLLSYLRRMRAYDLDGDGNGELLAGGEDGRLVMLYAVEGQNLLNERFSRHLGQTITEIRAAEIDGDPAAQEFVVGGKDGGVWAFSAAGKQLWSASLPDKITEIAGLDVDDDGAEEVVVGDDSGEVAIFSGPSGSRQALGAWPSGIMRIDAGRLTGSDQVVVADGQGLKVLALTARHAPRWYSPLLAGLLVAGVIAFAAWFIATLPPKPVLRAAAEDQSVEGLLARNRMLHESLADVERLRGSHEMPAEAYLARLRALRGDLAATQADLLKTGYALKAETVQCPRCGGSLPLGLDKCDYCGAVVIA